jgi:prolyl-tRNA synthetase
MRFKDRHDKELVLGPTAEEVFAYIVRTGITSVKQLPTFLYNIQWKYRDEIRPRFGLIRCREFFMCDGYSFNLSPVELEQFYTTALDGYVQMFKELGFANPMPIQQNDTGAVGGSMSHEFFVEADVGEDEIKIERDGESYMARVIELGHIYNLGTKYSEPMNLRFDDKLVWMGCYGVGVSRVVQALIEVLGSEKKMLWPESVAPFRVHFIGCDDPESANLGNILKAKLNDEVYLDFSGKNFGEKMAIADLIGSPHRIIYMQREIKEGIVVHNGVKTAISDIKHLFNLHSCST